MKRVTPQIRITTGTALPHDLGKEGRVDHEHGGGQQEERAERTRLSGGSSSQATPGKTNRR